MKKLLGLVVVSLVSVLYVGCGDVAPNNADLTEINQVASMGEQECEAIQRDGFSCTVKNSGYSRKSTKCKTLSNGIHKVSVKHNNQWIDVKLNLLYLGRGNCSTGPHDGTCSYGLVTKFGGSDKVTCVLVKDNYPR